MLYIAENLKALRKNKGMTQEDIADAVGVSPQSVSKWECGDTYPDITLLPSLANLYNTSVDSLIGMEKINDDKAIAAAFLEGQKLQRDGDNAKAAEVFSKALKLYPNNDALTLELALVLAIEGDPEKIAKAELLCERILTGNASESVCSTARAVLSYIYLKSGEREKAVNTAQKLPHVAVCRFTVLEEIEKNPSTDDINRLLRSITFRENAEHDILVVEFGIDMLPIVEEGKLLEKISEARNEAGKNKVGQYKIPSVRVRDNIELAPNQVRLRYYYEYLMDEKFENVNFATEKIVEVLREIK